MTDEARFNAISADDFNRIGAGCLPGHLGIDFTVIDREHVVCRMPVRAEVMAPNGFLHAGSLALFRCTQMVLWPKG
jgi:acyl-coenzyme A thioesterase PaaI-like protein